MVLSLDLTSSRTPYLARHLLGQFLWLRRSDGQLVCFVITETECYHGPSDLASHASRGRTARTEVMFGPAGFWYVYLVYGLHHMLNIVTGPADFPAAVLIRGAALLDDNKHIVKPISRPARLTKFMGLDKAFNCQPASLSTGLWLTDGLTLKSSQITASPRVGVAYAGPIWSQKPWRFIWSSHL